MHLPSPGDDAIIYHNFDPRFQSRDQSPYNHNGVLVGPVVQDEAEKVYICPFDGLFLEEIVGLESHPFSDIWRRMLLLSLRDNVEGVLDDDASDIGVVREESLRHMAQSPADIDDGQLVLGGGTPWKCRG